MRFVVIGGDAAGMSAASRAKRNDPNMDVIVLEAGTDVSYSACGMPYNIADPTRDMDDLVVRSAPVFREKQGIDVRLGHRVQSLDIKNKKVNGVTELGDAFSVEYDKLVLATGSRSRTLSSVPGSDLPGVMTLKSLEDGRGIKQYIASRDVKSAIIVGTGYIGLEMAEALYSLNIRTDMVEALPSLLPWLPPDMAEVVLNELTDKGIGVQFGVTITSIGSDGSQLSLSTDQGKMAADLILVGIGVIPNAELAADAGLELGPAGSVAVDKQMRTSDPDIYAAGDCADAFHVVTARRVWIPLALRANRGGWAVGDNVTGKSVELPGIVGTAVFKVLDLEVARAGLGVAEARQAGFDPFEAVISSRSRAWRHEGSQTLHVQLIADRETGKLLGGSMVGKEGAAHRVDAIAVALHAGMTVSEFSQCDMAYAPPFSPVWDPMLTAANQLLKKM
jgi:CoA-dependent NAD(P)H sulfur oxidoreductase